MLDEQPETDDEIEVPGPPPAPKFTEFLNEHRGGALDIELAETLDEVVDAVLRTGKAGDVTLKLKVSKNGDMMVAIMDDVNGKIPVLDEPRLYWRGTDGRLTRDNPMAPRIPGT
jgi:ribosomal protein S28E/S33